MRLTRFGTRVKTYVASQTLYSGLFGCALSILLRIYTRPDTHLIVVEAILARRGNALVEDIEGYG